MFTVLRNIQKSLKQIWLFSYLICMFSEFNKMHKIEIKQVLFEGRKFPKIYTYNFIWLSSQPFKHIFKFLDFTKSHLYPKNTGQTLYILQGITLLHSALTLQKSSSQFQLSKLGSYCQ